MAVEDTIFIRNLSFDTDESALKQFIEENFGPTSYCLICKCKETGDSKGTAFAQFQNPEDASKCLAEFKDRDLMTKFHLDGRNLIVLPAISRDKIGEVAQVKSKCTAKRNLALAYVGGIHPESEEAKSLSKGDLEKRQTLFTRKRELLKNLHNFVSDTRLCVHNLPASVDDKKLMAIFEKSVKSKFPQAKIIECRVMRNKKGSGELGTSKGFGFVAFSKHEHALAALKSLNNKPDVFTNDKRPIVEFSIENLVALNKKKTRLANSKRKNEHIRSKSEQTPSKNQEKNNLKKTKLKKKAMKMKKKATVF